MNDDRFGPPNTVLLTLPTLLQKPGGCRTKCSLINTILSASRPKNSKKIASSSLVLPTVLYWYHSTWYLPGIVPGRPCDQAENNGSGRAVTYSHAQSRRTAAIKGPGKHSSIHPDRTTYCTCLTDGEMRCNGSLSAALDCLSDKLLDC